MYLQSHISKNISVSFDFITTWNQGLFLCSSCIIEPNCVSLAKFVTEPNRILLSQIVYYWAKRKEMQYMIMIFLKVVISLRGGRWGYSPLASET